MNVYLDNAATTAIDKEVFEVMKPYFTEFYGNPSSIHATGRKSRAAIEQARKTIASLIGATSSEIIFTSGGTEAINIFLSGSVSSVSHIISSPIEHPAVLETLNFLTHEKQLKLVLLECDHDGRILPDAVDKALELHPRSLVALMHGNNEVGNLLPLQEIAKICNQHKVPLFTDAVQTIGHYDLNLQTINITGLSASAHKFHGPKGVGFLYLRNGTQLTPSYRGGAQERGLRVGTENVAAIVGMAKALELSYATLEEDRNHIESLKRSLIDLLEKNIPEIKFNGLSAAMGSSLYTVLSTSFPENEQNDMLLFNLDLANISVSAGSACASGASTDSHVLIALKHNKKRATVRFSFSKSNKQDELEYVIKSLKEILNLT